MTTYKAKCGIYGIEKTVSAHKRLKYMPYAQASIIIDNDIVYLKSYSTIVATIDVDGWITCNGTYSQTTRKHISAFAKQYSTRLSYYDFKRCYNDNIAYNYITGEKIPINQYRA